MIIFISGARNSGKTLLLERLYSSIKNRKDKTISGLLLKKENNAECYQALDLQSGLSKLFCEKKKDFQFGYVFNQEGLNFANTAIADSLKSDIILIDEIGRLELGGGGLAPSFEKVLHCGALIIAAISAKNINRAIERWQIDPKNFDIDELGIDKALELLLCIIYKCEDEDDYTQSKYENPSNESVEDIASIIYAKRNKKH
jgi:nucleoside-triphosphatase THEP1